MSACSRRHHCQTSKQAALYQCCFYAGPTSQMVGQNKTSIGSTSRVCWVCWEATLCFEHCQCEDITTVAPLIESKDDLVSVDHLPGSKSWHNEASGVANLAEEDAVDIKNGFHHIKIHSLYCPQEPFNNIKGTPWDETFSILSILTIYFIWSYIAYWS